MSRAINGVSRGIADGVSMKQLVHRTMNKCGDIRKRKQKVSFTPKIVKSFVVYILFNIATAGNIQVDFAP